MTRGWLGERTRGIAALGGYKKPPAGRGPLKMDSNENYAIPASFQEAARAAAATPDEREYPLGGAERLVEALSAYTGMPAAMIGVGCGSDQILDMILSSFAPAGARVLTSDPTFSFFEERCKLRSITMDKVPFGPGMELDASEMASRSGGADMLYLDSPNNPTGFQFPRGELEGLVRSFDGLVIIDEAYGEFGRYTLSGLAAEVDNLVVVRTLSKSFGLAGLRLGYFVAPEEFTDAFMRVVQYPYPLASHSIEAGIAALADRGAVGEAVSLVRSERARITEALSSLGQFEVFKSDANFVLFDAGGAYGRVHSALAEQGIAVRRVGRVGERGGCLRVGVGSPEMNSRFLSAVHDLMR